MGRAFLLFILFAANIHFLPAQGLIHLPPVVTHATLKDTSLSFLLSTFDMRRFSGNQTQKYENSVQIVDAATPWPPRWYTSVPMYTDSMYQLDTAGHLWRLYFVFDPKVDRGQLSFFKELTLTKIGEEKAASDAGYIILNHQMEPVDTVRSTTKHAMYYHDFRINSRNEKLVDIKMDTVMDLSGASGDQKDSAVRSKIDIIQIQDANNKVVFSWNPIGHLDPSVFDFKESLKHNSFSSSDKSLIEWSRLTSAVFDYDGDILYSMRFVGIGKISRKDGHVIWHIDFKDIPLVSYNDTIRWYSVHDFNYLGENDTASFYSLFSLGDDEFPRAGGVVFELNKTSHKIKLIRNIYAKYQFKGIGQGSCEVLNSKGDYILSYGIFPEPGENVDFRTFAEYGNKRDSIYASYQMPELVYAYKIRELKDWPRPPRPIITLRGSTLFVEGPMTDWTWYRLDGPNNSRITKLGTGPNLKIRYSGAYCVEGKYGMGYSVSVPFNYKIKEKNEPY